MFALLVSSYLCLFLEYMNVYCLCHTAFRKDFWLGVSWPTMTIFKLIKCLLYFWRIDISLYVDISIYRKSQTLYTQYFLLALHIVETLKAMYEVSFCSAPTFLHPPAYRGGSSRPPSVLPCAFCKAFSSKCNGFPLRSPSPMPKQVSVVGYWVIQCPVPTHRCNRGGFPP